MAELNEEDAERLASRLAMMVSEEGEAANAGRALSQMARRLGLTGGELKEMFLSGAAGGRPARGETAFTGAPRDEVERLEQEIAMLRKGLRMLEATQRDLLMERDALAAELEDYRGRTESARNSSRLRAVAAGVILLALAGAASVGFLMAVGDATAPQIAVTPAPPIASTPSMLGQRMAPLPPPTLGAGQGAASGAGSAADYGAVTRRVGVVKNGRAVVYRVPDRGAPAVATLQSGMPIVVRRVFYNLQTQWAEVEVGSSVGYVLMTDVDVS